jgi:hypothetical protein
MNIYISNLSFNIQDKDLSGFLQNLVRYHLQKLLTK